MKIRCSRFDTNCISPYWIIFSHKPLVGYALHHKTSMMRGNCYQPILTLLLSFKDSLMCNSSSLSSTCLFISHLLHSLCPSTLSIPSLFPSFFQSVESSHSTHFPLIFHTAVRNSRAAPTKVFSHFEFLVRNQIEIDLNCLSR